MLKLRRGTSFCIEVEQLADEFELTVKTRVGNFAPKTHGKAKRVSTEEQLWVEIGRFADDRLARLGLEKTSA